MKRYLNTPEEVVQALQAGKKVQTDYMEYWFSKGVFFSLNKKDGYVCINSNVLFIPDCMYVEEPESLKLEVGGFYKTRDGRKAWITECTDLKGTFPFRVATQRECNTYIITKDGRRYLEDTDGTDLVAPWED